MAQHRPIVLRSGRLTELPVGDTVAGAGFDPSALPLASNQTPQAFIVQQAGQWVLASYAQMAAWFAGAPALEHGYGLLTEAGEFLLTESGEYLVQEAGAAGAYVLTELGGALLTEAGGFITQELT